MYVCITHSATTVNKGEQCRLFKCRYRPVAFSVTVDIFSWVFCYCCWCITVYAQLTYGEQVCIAVAAVRTRLSLCVYVHTYMHTWVVKLMFGMEFVVDVRCLLLAFVGLVSHIAAGVSLTRHCIFIYTYTYAYTYTHLGVFYVPSSTCAFQQQLNASPDRLTMCLYLQLQPTLLSLASVLIKHMYILLTTRAYLTTLTWRGRSFTHPVLRKFLYSLYLLLVCCSLISKTRVWHICT